MKKARSAAARRKGVTSAITLYVKNEHSDIAGWIAWHLALGFDALYLFDDHSSDGTWEMMQVAAATFPDKVFAFRTDEKIASHFHRQSGSFKKAVELSKNKQTWLIQLDGDEYLFFKGHDTVNQFLAGFRDADAIAINWCVFGGNHKVLRPKKLTVEAFTMRSTEKLSANGMVKSFVRPDKFAEDFHVGHWFPHWLPIPVERYVRPSGAPCEQTNIHQAPVEWSHAMVMHYVVRSLEHYVQRMKRKRHGNLDEAIHYWKAYDINAVETHEAFIFLPKAKEILAALNSRIIEFGIESIYKSKLYPIKRGSYKKIEQKNHQVRTIYNTLMCMDPETGQILHALNEEISKKGYIKINAVIFADTPTTATLLPVNNPKSKSIAPIYPSVPGDDRMHSELHYRLSRHKERLDILINVLTSRVMTFWKPTDGVGTLEATHLISLDRPERLTLLEPISASVTKLPGVHFFIPPEALETAKSFLTWFCSAPELPSVSTFLRGAISLPEEERERIDREMPGLFWHLTGESHQVTPIQKIA